MRLWAAALLLAAGCRCGAPAQPKVSSGGALPPAAAAAAGEGEAEADVREAARDAAADEVLALPAELQKRAVELAVRAGAVSSVESACALLPGASALAAELQDHLGERFTALWNKPGFDELSEAIDALGDALPLITAEQHASGVIVSVDEAAMAEQLGPATPGGRVLAAAAQVAAEPWLVRNLEESCLDHELALPALEALASAWPAAPRCLQETLRAPLVEALRDATSGTWCASKPEAALGGAAGFARALARLPELDGPAIGKLAEENARRPDLLLTRDEE